MMTFSARDHEFYGRHLATITVGRPALTIALPQRRPTSVAFMGANLTLTNAVGEAILKNGAGQTLASDYLTLNYDVNLGFESTEYDRVTYNTTLTTEPKEIILDGYFEPVAQALIKQLFAASPTFGAAAWIGRSFWMPITSSASNATSKSGAM